jgi:hypothetical protein
LKLIEKNYLFQSELHIYLTTKLKFDLTFLNFKQASNDKLVKEYEDHHNQESTYLKEIENQIIQKDNELKQKDSELKRKETELELKNTELRKKNDELQQKNQRIQNNEDKLLKKDVELRAKDSELKKEVTRLEAKNAELQATLVNCNIKNAELEVTLADCELKNDKLDAKNAELKVNLVQIEGALKKKEGELKRENSEMRQKNTQHALVNSQLRERIIKLDRTATNDAALIGSMTTKINQFRQHNKTANDQILHLKTEIFTSSGKVLMLERKLKNLMQAEVVNYFSLIIITS